MELFSHDQKPTIAKKFRQPNARLLSVRHRNISQNTGQKAVLRSGNNCHQVVITTKTYRENKG
jgi:hypothetical protein